MSREIREPNSLTSIAFNTGVIAERRRIIKLLENGNCKPNDHDYNGGCNCDVIALIQKETK